jgi:hypothetical protein
MNWHVLLGHEPSESYAPGYSRDGSASALHPAGSRKRCHDDPSVFLLDPLRAGADRQDSAEAEV